MARVSISTLVFDPDGYQELTDIDERASDLGGLSRRVSRTPTLDGGAVVNDSGHSPSDRTILIAFAPSTTAAQILAMHRIVKTYSTVILSLPDGVYLAAPSAIRTTNGKTTLTLLISEALQEYY